MPLILMLPAAAILCFVIAARSSAPGRQLWLGGGVVLLALCAWLIVALAASDLPH